MPLSRTSTLPRTHLADRRRVWRFAALVMVFASLVTCVEAIARPDAWRASVATGLFPLLGAPVSWFRGPKLSPQWSYRLGRIFLVLGVLSASASMYTWRGTQVAGGMGFHLVLAVVFAAAFFHKRDLVYVLVLSGVTSLAALVADGLHIEDVLAWLPMMLALCGAGLMLSAVTRRADTLAYGDPLTGAANRRGWDIVFQEAADRHASGDRAMSVLLVDLDNFKAVNDRFGHGGGDDVLKGAVHSWQALLRTGDILARLGGDEFALLLEGVDHAHAMEIGERLVTSVDVQTGVTCSVGVATLGPGADPDLLISAADNRLYAAKHAGRNVVRGIEVNAATTEARLLDAAPTGDTTQLPL
jgi:diguanylate cyclase (GGDEF)-like protein